MTVAEAPPENSATARATAATTTVRVSAKRPARVIRSGVAGTSGTAVPVGRETSCGRAGRTGTRTGAGATSQATAALIWSSIGAVCRGLVVASIERVCEELPR